MMRCTRLRVIVPLLVVSVASVEPASGQTSVSTFLASFLGEVRDNGLSTDGLGNLLKRELENPETLNSWIDKIFASGGGRLLSDLSVEFKTFSVAESDEGSLGFTYSFDKDIDRQYFGDDGVGFGGVAANVHADGNVAFERDVNPRDFLRSNFAIHFFRSMGGAVPSSQSDSVGRLALQRGLNALEDSLVAITDQRELDTSPVWREFANLLGEHLTTQIYVDFGLSGNLESDQSFDQTQIVYAGHLGLDVKAWNRNSTLAQWNVFDWPFAALRYLSGIDADFAPRGSAIPTVIVGLGVVDPKQDDFRESVGETSNYVRFRLEAAFKTLMLRVEDLRVFFESNFRYYREIDAPASVRVADRDHTTYFVGAIAASNGMFVSYSTGRLPFDEVNDQVYELGFRFRF